MSIQFLQGDCLTILKTLPDASVQCCVTSPPYYGLRSYLNKDDTNKSLEIGSEETPAEYIERMVGLFREVRRVLKEDGTLWLNLGDSIASSTQSGTGEPYRKTSSGKLMPPQLRTKTPEGLKKGDRIGIPWRVAFALQEDGWFLRSECPWIKRNAMPESAKNRPTTVVESVFMLTKTNHAYYDHEAVKVMAKYPGDARHLRKDSRKIEEPLCLDGGSRVRTGNPTGNPTGKTRSRRSSDWFFESWQGLYQDEEGDPLAFIVNTKPYKGAHFACFPPKLIEPCVIASCPQGGVVLDPFGGSGTTGQVAKELGRDAILIELNPVYIELAKKRCGVS